MGISNEYGISDIAVKNNRTLKSDVVLSYKQVKVPPNCYLFAITLQEEDLHSESTTYNLQGNTH